MAPVSLSKRLSTFACVIVGLAGCLVLLGWKFDIAILKSGIPGFVAMKANAALALILSAFSLWLSARESDARLLLLARVFAFMVVLLGLLTLAEHLLALEIPLDQILFSDPSETEPGRMDPATAVVFILLGIELAALAGAIDVRIAQSLALATGALSLVALAGYVYGIAALYSPSPSSAAPLAALGFLLLSLGVLGVRSGAGLLASLAARNIGAALFRWLPAAVGIPLGLGYLIVLGRQKELYTPDVALALFALTNAAFLVLAIFLCARSLARQDEERARTQRRLQRDIARLRALRDGEQAVSSAPEPGAVPGVLLEKAELLISVTAATTVRLFNRQSGELETAAGRNRDGEPWTLDETKALGARAKKVFETKMPMTVRNLQSDGQVYNQIFRQQGWISHLGVPLLARGEALGVLGVYTEEQYEFTPEDIECLSNLASRAALAIYNVEFQVATVPSTSEKIEAGPIHDHQQRLLGRLPGLYATLAPLNASESLRETIEGIIDKLIEATGADAALIRVWRKDTGAALAAGFRGISEDYFKQMDIGLLGGALEWVVQHGEPIIAPDIAAEPRFKTNLHQQLGFRSCALLPVKINRDVRGVIHLAGRNLGDFDEAQKDLFMAIAQQMGISMENRELFDHIKNSKDELEKASKVKDEFLSVMSHELRTPLAVVLGYAGMIKEKLLGEINEKQEDALQKLLTRGNDQLNMINAIMQITQLESRALVIERHLLNLTEMLGHLKSDYILSHTDDKVALAWDYPSEPVAIVTDSGKLKEILVNLINNALKFTPKGSVTISMRLTEDQRRRWVELKVADSGIGIAEADLDKIFDKFYQVDSSETRLYGGVGLGLYIVKHFTASLGGKLHVASEPGKGTTFVITIPYST
jgi:signal transduction histidine kinase